MQRVPFRGFAVLRRMIFGDRSWHTLRQGSMPVLGVPLVVLLFIVVESNQMEVLNMMMTLTDIFLHGNDEILELGKVLRVVHGMADIIVELLVIWNYVFPLCVDGHRDQDNNTEKGEGINCQA